MRYKFLIVILLQVVFKVSNAQNLVPNGNFEDIISCPTDLGQVYTCTGWVNCGDSVSTPDYYNNCNTGVANPLSNGIYQVPHSGVGYGAFATLVEIPNYREFIGHLLSQSLIVGQKYFFSFYVTLGYCFAQGSPSNNIGMKLFTAARSTQNPIHISNTSTFNITQFVSDTANWEFYQGSFFADSAYNFIAFGNYYSDSNTDTIIWNPTANTHYYAIDDICLSTDSLQCAVQTGLAQIDNEQLTLYPNPATDHITIESNYRGPILIYDFLGQLVDSYEKTGENLTIDVSRYSPGMYLIRTKRGSGYKFVIK